MSERTNNPIGILSGSTLKIIACILMAIDHIGFHLFPNVENLRIIGRLSMPIFAYLISEGCYYTKNKLKHFLLVFISGLLFLIGVLLFTKFTSGYYYWLGNIFLQFSVSILYIYLLQFLKKFAFSGNFRILKITSSTIIFILALVPLFYLHKVKMFGSNFFDYSYFMVTLTPVFISLFDLKDYTNHPIVKYIDNFYVRIIITTICSIFIANHYGATQWYSLLSIPILLLYNGKVGIKGLKYAFYAFYPVHIIIIYIIKFIMTL